MLYFPVYIGKSKFTHKVENWIGLTCNKGDVMKLSLANSTVHSVMSLYIV